jgi:phage-related protein
MKPLEFVGSTQDDLKNFPAEARRDAGFQLNFVQMGQEPADWKPMKTVGSGAMEIRIHREGEWRVVYVAKFEKAVYVLHAFEKKTQQTRQADIELAKARYKEVEAHEKAKQKRKR